eukprot:NODE_65_length_23997_cov_0.327601.p14 type:complete len:191 gc:universal NODE_65_length_23997_cov_0.327601:19854-20426(+)
MNKLAHYVHIPNLRVFPKELPIEIIPNFISTAQEDELTSFCNLKLKKFKYESNHFDSVITNYRECMVDKVPFQDKIMSYLSKFSTNWQAFHILDLHKSGIISYHLDSYAGPHIAGLCLKSDSVMHFKSTNLSTHPISDIYLFLPRRSIYIQHGYVRDFYEHALLKSYDCVLPSHFNIENSQRISILIRNP